VHAPKVSDEQAIMQAIKALCARQIHSHLVTERPRTLQELYEEFQKFSKVEILHFRKLDQQRKSARENESSRPFKYNKSKEVHSNFDTSHRQVHSIDSDGCRPPKNWEKNFRPPRPESENRAYDPRKDRTQTGGGHSSRGQGKGQF
jgi:hypothetical protein